MKKFYNLIIGLSGPYGAGCSSLSNDLKQIVDNWPGCKVKTIQVSKLIQNYYKPIFSKGLKALDENLPERRKILQQAGTELRKEDPELIGKIISSEIYKESLKIEKSDEKTNVDTLVFIIDSLKNKYDLDFLKKTYSNEFYFVFIHADKETRWQRMTDYKAWKMPDRVQFEKRDLVDQNEKNLDPTVKDRGQQVQKLSSRADFYIVNNGNRKKMKTEGERFINILFGDEKNQPTIHERYMHLAYSASNASFCLSRQVGAAIIDARGNILGVGHNDVPKATGGLYSFEDESDMRCYSVGDRRCINDTNKEERFDDLADEITSKLALKSEQIEILKKVLEKSPFSEVIEYCRAAHAEMDALLSVARAGTGSTLNATMYVTTEPCHNCTKHIICAGIRKVFFMEPYPKSLGLELHSDAIIIGSEFEKCTGDKVLFIPYEGIAPHRFHDFFAQISDRKDDSGKFIVKRKAKQSLEPRFTSNVFKRSREDEKQLDTISSFEYKSLIELADLLKSKEDTQKQEIKDGNDLS